MADAPDPVRRFYEAVNSEDPASAAELMTGDIRWVRPPNVPIGGTLQGRDQVARMWRAFSDQLESFSIEPTRFRDMAAGTLVHVTFKGEGKGGGQFEFAGSQTFRLGEGGLISEVREFKSIPEGEADLGT